MVYSGVRTQDCRKAVGITRIRRGKITIRPSHCNTPSTPISYIHRFVIYSSIRQRLASTRVGASKVLALSRTRDQSLLRFAKATALHPVNSNPKYLSHSLNESKWLVQDKVVDRASMKL